MESIDRRELTSGYRERMRRLALMDSLVELERKRVVDQQGNPLDMRGIGMLTLLFFFERRLTREYKTGVRHLISFLRQMMVDTYILDKDKIDTVELTMLITIRQKSGVTRYIKS